MWNPLNTLRRYRHLRRVDSALAAPVSGIEPELKILHRYLKPNEAFFDVGANVGDYMYVAQKYISAEHIYAFEPQETYVRSLRKYFPRANVVHCALSSASGERQLKIPIIKGAEYRTRGTLEHFREPGEEGVIFETVPVLTLDSVAESFGNPPIACIKIDVEGHERAVLEGAGATIARCKPVLFVEVEQRHHSEPIADIFRFIESFGYDGYFLNTKQELVPLSEFNIASHQSQESFKTSEYINNFIFLLRKAYGKD